MNGKIKRLPLVLAMVGVLTALSAGFSATASADKGFEADVYPAYLESEDIEYSRFEWFVPYSKSFCKSGGDFEATLDATASRFTTDFIGGCSSGGAVNMNGCKFAFGPGQKHPLAIGPPGCGPISMAGGGDCALVEAQEPSGAFEAQNRTTKFEEDGIELFVWVKDLTYEDCSTEKVGNNLNLLAIWGVRAWGGELFELTGLRFSEELELPASLAAYDYPATVSGDGSSEFSIDAGEFTFSCADSSLETTLTEAGTDLEEIDSEQSDCELDLEGGEEPIEAHVVMNSCHYTLGVQGDGAPYTGDLGVECDNPEDKIEYRIQFLGNRPCIDVGPQSELEGVSLSQPDAWTVDLDMDVESVAWTRRGLCGSESGTNGLLSGSSTLSSPGTGVYLQG